MASTSSPIGVETRGRLFTAADLAKLPTHLPSGDVDYELDRGRLIVMVPPGHIHAAAQLRIGGSLLAQGEKAGLGRAFTEVGLVLSRRPDTVLGPDVAFVSAAKLPVRESPEGYLDTIPDLAIEVRSRNDTSAELATKVTQYLAAEVRGVCVADPEARTITMHRVSAAPVIRHDTDTLTIDDVIPGFRLEIAELFAV